MCVWLVGCVFDSVNISCDCHMVRIYLAKWYKLFVNYIVSFLQFFVLT